MTIFEDFSFWTPKSNTKQSKIVQMLMNKFAIFILNIQYHQLPQKKKKGTRRKPPKHALFFLAFDL